MLRSQPHVLPKQNPFCSINSENFFFGLSEICLKDVDSKLISQRAEEEEGKLGTKVEILKGTEHSGVSSWKALTPQDCTIKVESALHPSEIAGRAQHWLEPQCSLHPA